MKLSNFFGHPLNKQLLDRVDSILMLQGVLINEEVMGFKHFFYVSNESSKQKF